MGTLGLLWLLGPLWLWALMLGDSRWILALLPTSIFWLIKAAFQSQEWSQKCTPKVVELMFSSKPGKLGLGWPNVPSTPSLPEAACSLEPPDTPGVGTVKFLGSIPTWPLEFLTWSWPPISVLLAPDYFPFCPDPDLSFKLLPSKLKSSLTVSCCF